MLFVKVQLAPRVSLRLACNGGVDREERPFSHDRSDLDPVTKDLKRAADDGETDAQAVAAFGRKACERLEDSRQLMLWNADTRVV